MIKRKTKQGKSESSRVNEVDVAAGAAKICASGCPADRTHALNKESLLHSDGIVQRMCFAHLSLKVLQMTARHVAPVRWLAAHSAGTAM